LLDRPFSKTGCFLVNSNKILNKKFDYYYSLLMQMKNWKREDFQAQISEFKKVLFDK
jgi:hypothetical protein